MGWCNHWISWAKILTFSFESHVSPSWMNSVLWSSQTDRQTGSCDTRGWLSVLHGHLVWFGFLGAVLCPAPLVQLLPVPVVAFPAPCLQPCPFLPVLFFPLFCPASLCLHFNGLLSFSISWRLAGVLSLTLCILMFIGFVLLVIVRANPNQEKLCNWNWVVERDLKYFKNFLPC